MDKKTDDIKNDLEDLEVKKENEDLQQTLDNLVKDLDKNNVVDQDNQKELIDTLEGLQKTLNKSNKLEDTNNKDLIESVNKLDDSINSLELDPTINYNVDGLDAKLDKLIDLLTPINEGLDFFISACSAVVTYSVFYIPLAVIVVCLWWFFKQFIR